MNKFSKFVKHGKRLVAIMLVLFMNINTYAAIGANDGSAFVTKAEFDALVNTFNEQMDSYENSVVSKIDGAIANYLASLSSTATYPQNLLVNNLSKYKFTNTWNLWTGSDDCELGDKMKWDIYISFMGMSISYNGTGIEWSAHRNGGSKGSKTSKYVLVNVSNYDSNRYSIAGRMTSTMVSSAKGTYSHGSLSGTPTATPGRFTPTDLYDTNNTETFGSRSTTLSGSPGGISQTIDVVVTYDTEDTIVNNVDMINYLSGGAVPTGKKLYLVKTNEINYKKSTDRSNKGYSQSGWVKINKYGENIYNQSNPYRNDYSVTGYYHKYYEVAADTGYSTFVVDDISSTADKVTTYYNGLPLIKATTDGDATVVFKLNGDTSAKHKFEIRAEQFDNNAITPGVSTLVDASASYVDSQGNVIKNVYEIPSGCEVTVKFKAKRDIIYWIKALPSAGLTSVVGVSANIYVE